MGYSSGFSRFDGEAFTNYYLPEEFSKDYIWIVDRNVEGNLLLQTYAGKVLEFDGKKIREYNFNHQILDTARISIIKYYKNQLYIGTWHNGLFIQKDSTIKSCQNIKGGIRNIIQDFNNNFFIVNREGVFQKIDDSLTLIFTNKEFKHLYTLQQSKGNYWAGSYRDGIFIKRKKEWNPVFGENQLGIYDMAEDSSGTVWAATHIGLYRIIDNMYDEIYDFPEIKDEIILRIFIDRNNNVWASTYGKGVYKLSKNEFYNFQFPSTFPDQVQKYCLKTVMKTYG